MDDAFAKRLTYADRLLGVIETGFNFFGGALVFALMFLGVVQIFLRAVFRDPIYGYIDIVEISMVGFAVLSISYVQKIGGHVRMELVVGHLKGRIKWLVEAISSGLGICLVGMLIPFSYNHFERALNFGDSTIDIELSTWPAKLVVPIALGILLLRLIIELFGFIRMTLHPDFAPVGVPVHKDVMQLAEEEIQHAEEDIVHEHPSDSRGGRV